jgi:hypothetical protein
MSTPGLAHLADTTPVVWAQTPYAFDEIMKTIMAMAALNVIGTRSVSAVMPGFWATPSNPGSACSSFAYVDELVESLSW